MGREDGDTAVTNDFIRSLHDSIIGTTAWNIHFILGKVFRVDKSP